MGLYSKKNQKDGVKMDANRSIDRLKNVLVQDKEQNPVKIMGILKNDITKLLSNYMEVDGDDVDVNLLVNNNGSYDLVIKSVVRRVKVIQTFVG